MAASAEESLTWHFKQGDVHRYRVASQLDATLALGESDSETRSIRHEIDMTWRVAEVKPGGDAVLTQRIDRLQMKLTSPGEDPVEYDSAAKGEPQGFAAMVAPLVKQITGADLKVTMTPLGEVTAVEIPPALLTALKNSAGADKLGDFATEKGFKNLVQTLSFRLPKEFKQGVEWSTKLESDNPLLGKLVCETTYKHKETKDVAGQQIEVFTPTLAMKFAGGPAAIAVSDEKSGGEIDFNRTAGRLETSKVEHSMKLALTAEGEKLAQELKQTVEMQRTEEAGK
jgi:hypothetical protein